MTFPATLLEQMIVVATNIGPDDKGRFGTIISDSCAICSAWHSGIRRLSYDGAQLPASTHWLSSLTSPRTSRRLKPRSTAEGEAGLT